MTSPLPQGFEFFTKAGMDAAQQAMSFGQSRFSTLNKSVDEVQAFGRETVEALVASATVAAEGVEELSAEILSYGKAQVDSSMAAVKTLMSVRSPQEFFAAQSAFAKSALDAFLAQSTKVGEIGARLAQSTAEPINARVQATVDKLVRPLSA